MTEDSSYCAKLIIQMLCLIYAKKLGKLWNGIDREAFRGIIYVKHKRKLRYGIDKTSIRRKIYAEMKMHLRNGIDA